MTQVPNRRKLWFVAVVTLLVVCASATMWFAADQRKQVGEREFMAAAAQGNISRMTQLLDTVDVNARFGGNGDTALHRAAARGHLRAVTLLLDRGASVNAVDDEGTTPLTAATYRGHKKVVKVLLERGAAVDAQEMRYRLNSLTHAVGRNDKELVKLLLRYGADPLLKAADGRTAVDRAEANGAKEIVALLRKAASKK
jgi:ankyrin repeat protein